MNKMITLMVLASILIIATPVSAISMFDFPISGQITVGDQGQDGVKVEAKNLRTSESVVTYTDPSGWYIISWGNTVNFLINGDEFRITVYKSDGSIASTQNQIASLSAGGLSRIDFSFTTSPGAWPRPTTTTTIPPTTTTLSCTTPTTQITECVPVEPPIVPGSPNYDWSAFLTGSGALLFLSFIAYSYHAHKGKVRIQFYERYRRTDGSYGYRWKTILARAD